MKKKANDFRKRLSLQNQNLGKNKLNEVLENADSDKPEENKENKENTEEIDHLKIFKEQQIKKEKEEESKKYLKPIIEEEDPLNYFQKKKAKEAEDEDPLIFLKRKEEKTSEGLPKMMGIMISEELNEKTLSEKIKNNDIPDEINIEKKTSVPIYTLEERKKKMEKRYKTSLRLTQRKGFEARAKDKLMQRLQNYKNLVNAGDTVKHSEINNEKKDNGNTLLSAEEQVSNNNSNNVITKKDVDLSSFMKKKNDN